MEKNWWKKAILYQIYPPSFKDFDGDGFGDIKGICEKIPYLYDLGINTILLSSILKSPMNSDYYISDHYLINPLFGSNEDLEELISICNKYDIKIILDVALNHTSVKHKWFLNAKNSQILRYKNFYYVVAKPDDFKNFFNDSNWSKFNEKEYYLHSFSSEQADLNWNNFYFRKEFRKVLNFWIEKGVHGFYFSNIDGIGKELEIEEPEKSNLINYYKLHYFIYDMKTKTKCNDHDFLIAGESWSFSTKNAILYTDPKRLELSMLLDYENMTSNWLKNKWDIKEFNLVDFKKVIKKWQIDLFKKGWSALCLNNHNFPRMVSNFGDLSYWEKSIKAISLTFYLLQGTPFIYQGEEIGMTNCDFNNLNEHKDIEVLSLYNTLKDKNKKWTEQDHLMYVKKNNVDNARTPMQWNQDINSGFCKEGINPWLKINPNYKTINVESQSLDKNSILNWYKNLIKIRNNSEISNIIESGNFILYEEESSNIFFYKREYKEKSFYVISNWSNEKITFDNTLIKDKIIFLNNYSSFEKTFLLPWQVIVFIN